MKATQVTTWIVLLLAVCPAVLMAQGKDRDQLSVALSNPGKPFKLHINLAGGSVNISTHDGSDLRIIATPQVNTNENTGQGKNQNVNINTNTNVNVNVNSGAAGNNTGRNKVLKVSQNGNEVVIGQLKQNNVLNVDISLPKNSISLNLSLNGKGKVNIENVAGQLEITSADGPIVLKNISGSAVATTVNGNIIATFSSVNTNAPMAFSTLIGNIDLSFPAQVKASLTLKSDEGTVFSDYSLAGAARTKMTRNKNGQYQSKPAGNISGILNGGGQEITITNMQGNIYLRKSK